jgi:hypothetical protein
MKESQTFRCCQCGGVLLHWVDDIMAETNTMCSTCGFHFIEQEGLCEDPEGLPLGAAPLTSCTVHAGRGFLFMAGVDGSTRFHPVDGSSSLEDTLSDFKSQVDLSRSYATSFNLDTRVAEVTWGGGRPQEWESRPDDGTWP